MLKVMIAPVTPFQQNCSIVWCDETMEGTAVDPGGDFDMLQQAIAEQGHHDHQGAADPRPCRPRLGGRHDGRALRREDRGTASRRPVPDRGPARVGRASTTSRPTSRSCPTAGSRTATRSRSATSPSTSCIVPATRRAMSCSCTSRRRWPSWATCCSAARSAAPTSRAATTSSSLNSIRAAAVAAGRRHHLRAGPRPDLDLRLGAQDQSLRRRPAVRRRGRREGLARTMTDAAPLHVRSKRLAGSARLDPPVAQGVDQRDERAARGRVGHSRPVWGNRDARFGGRCRPPRACAVPVPASDAKPSDCLAADR